MASKDCLGAAAAGGRLLGLDVMRFAAIAVVLADHGVSRFLNVVIGPKVSVEWNYFVNSSGFIGVQLFFVLSGFLIGSILLRDHAESAPGWVGAFWIRRWFRTLPNYYLFIFVNFALAAYIREGSPTLEHFVFAQNLTSANVGFFAVSWSLAVEEIFYVVLPLLLVGVGLLWHPASSRRRFLGATTLLILLPTVARLYANFATGSDGWNRAVPYTALLRLDAIGYGVLAAWLARYHRAWWGQAKKTQAVFGLVLIGASLWSLATIRLTVSSPSLEIYLLKNVFFVAAGGGTALLLPALVEIRSMPAIPTFVFRRGSLYAYSLYLVHWPLAQVINRIREPWQLREDGQIVMVCLIWLALCIAAAAIIYHAFEKPIMDLRERFARRPQSGSSAVRLLESGPVDATVTAR